MRRGSIPETPLRYRSSRPNFSFRFTSVPRQIFCRYHRPCLKRIALAAAMADSAMAIEKNTPLERMCKGMANT
jgi:hypothetical protein